MSIENLLTDLIKSLDANTAAVQEANKGRAELMKKAEAPAAATKKTESKKAEPDAAPAKKSESKKGKASEFSETDVKNAIADVMGLADEGSAERKAIKKQILALFDQFGVEKSTELQPKQYAEFIETIGELKAKIESENDSDDGEDEEEDDI